MADQILVSLGDSGIATLTFGGALYNGPGADLAVFENGFSDPNNPDMAFLELAFVEVSSDGQNFYRFPPHSLTPMSPQIPVAGVFMDAKLINNLAGKYINMYGTPFDLEDLAGTAGLDIYNVTQVRIVDVIGSMSSLHGTQDTAGNLINDPYPTNIPTGGFDLDAVGAIHMNPASVKSTSATSYRVYPNPAVDNVTISFPGKKIDWSLRDITGRGICGGIFEDSKMLSMSEYGTGVYYLYLQDENGNKCVERIVKH
jgi:hypothetical protein